MKFIRVFLLVLIIIGIVLLFTQKFWVPRLVGFILKSEDVHESVTGKENSSIQGCYVDKLGKDIYTLNIQEEKNGKVTGMLAYNNYQKDSSSGAFTGTFMGDILLGNYSFDSEGMHSDRQVIFKKMGNNFVEGFGEVKIVGNKEVFTNVDALTYDPKSTFVKNKDCLEHFTDASSNISFDYNSFFSASEGDRNLHLNWRLDAAEPGVSIAEVFVPHTYIPPSTNFSDAELTFGRSSDREAIKNCFGSIRNDEKILGRAVIGGLPFTKFAFSGAAAGNFYDTTSYRGIVDGDCYAIEYTIHSTNIGNYSPDQGIKEFDKTKIQTELEKIIKSIKFLVNSD